MILREFDDILWDFISKYSFFSDPIFLFNTDDEVDVEKILSWNLDVNYPLVDKIKNNLDILNKDFYNIEKTFLTLDINDDFLKNQYYLRLENIKNTIKLIDIFYDKDEYLKFDLINKIFWVDLNFCKNEVFLNKQVFDDEFQYYLNKSDFYDELYKKSEKLLDKIYNANEIKKYFEEALNFLWIWDKREVLVDKNVAAIVHWDFTKDGWKIFIPYWREVNFTYLISLIIHEIDWHSRQFTNNSKIWILCPNIRTPNSEWILEWLAIYLENAINALVFKTTKIDRTFWDFHNKILFLKKEISLEELVNRYRWNNIFRVFRWFKNTNEYINTKDLVYLEWLYKLIKYKQKYWKWLFDTIYSWVINEQYIERNCKISNEKYYLENYIKNTSAFYILTKILW